MIEFLLAFAAGVISVLSPCVLPLIPVIFSAGRFSPVETFLIVFTMVSTFTALGFVAGSFSSLESTKFVSYILLLVFAVLMIDDRLYEKYVAFSSRVAGKFSRFSSPLILGFSLGLIWSPCIGPIVGALLSYSATTSKSVGALVMLSYGVGISSTLAVVVSAPRKFSSEKIAKYEKKIRKISGYLIVAYVVLFATGIYSEIEVALARLIPL